MKGGGSMSYSISEVAQMMNITPSALRYYDKEGLLPGVKRINGIRVFEDKDFAWLRILNCLKNTGMPIKRIKEYAELAKLGDESLERRYHLIQEQRQYVQDQIDQLNYYMQELDFKDWYYRTAIKAGSEDDVRISDYEASLEPDCIPKNARKSADGKKAETKTIKQNPGGKRHVR
jgi:DNA-binding transcriptional MerR regulator